MKPIFKEIDNKMKAKYFKLLRDGYYLRPEIFDNGTVYSICKDLNPSDNGCTGYRREYGQVNINTANFIRDNFGFIIKNPEKYFGKCEPVKNYEIRYWVYN